MASSSCLFSLYSMCCIDTEYQVGDLYGNKCHYDGICKEKTAVKRRAVKNVFYDFRIDGDYIVL